MTDADIQDFVTRFAAAWAARDPQAFLALWHPDGTLCSPLYDRPVAGKDLGKLTEIVRQAAPDHVWQLLDWTARGDVVMVEWRGVDKSACATAVSPRSAPTWTRRRCGRHEALCGRSR